MPGPARNTNLAIQAPLTLGPGVVVKLAPGALVSVQAKLTVLGTTQSPVILTSRSDDSAGGAGACSRLHPGPASRTMQIASNRRKKKESTDIRFERYPPLLGSPCSTNSALMVI